jgi:cytochrome c peroxidase
MLWLRQRIHFGALFGLLFLLAMRPAAAHIVPEEPWDPVAAAYRSALFLADLTPVSWEQVETAWSEPHPGAVSADPALDRLGRTEAGQSAAKDIRAAIEAEDRQALYESMTRAMSSALRAALDRAATELENGDPHSAIKDAQAIWRAFDQTIAEADPEGWRRVGRAWLELVDSAGARGMLGAGQIAADHARFEAAAAEITGYIRENFEPETFTRRNRMAPIPEAVVISKGEVAITPWMPPGNFIGDQTPLPLLVLNFEEQGIDETDLPLVAYGDMLFDSPEIFGNPARSLGIACSTCHNRSDINRDFFIPGVSHQPGAADVDGGFFNPVFNDRRDDSLDIPTLRGLRFTGPYGRDGRFASLREFTRNVIVGEFGGDEPTPFMLDALVAYLLEFDFLPNAKVTGDGRLTERASEAALRGEAIFKRPFEKMDGKSCASCHMPSANFLDRRAHDIGSGKGGYVGARAGAFDTPTLLGANFTAPYFHDGSLPTHAAVVDWFDERYGLALSEAEKADLTAYLEAVGDADQPYEVFEDRHTPFRLAFEELTTFASTLDMLIPDRDAKHAKLMIDTVAADLAADASGMANLSAKAEVYELSRTLADVGAAIDAGDWATAKAHWMAFKAHQAAVDERMY